MAIGPDLPAALKHLVDEARKGAGQTRERTAKNVALVLGVGILTFDDEMDVVLLDREVDDVKLRRIGTARLPPERRLQCIANELAPKRPHRARRPQGDERGKPRLVRRTTN